MTVTQQLNQRIDASRSFLCVGLDPQAQTLQQLDVASQLLSLQQALVDAVAEYACAFKPQFAHFAALGQEQTLAKLCRYIKTNYPSIPLILDSKRGDIGSTAEKYAIEAFERYQADAVTLNPYMGSDSLTPFLAHQDKAGVVLVRTSNASGSELQDLPLHNGKLLYQHLAEQLVAKYPSDNLWFVVGATQPTQLAELRAIAPHTTFLVPGVGAQGGDSQQVIQNAMTKEGYGLVINVSRGISAIDPETRTMDEYLDSAQQKAKKFQQQFSQIRAQLK